MVRLETDDPLHDLSAYLLHFGRKDESYCAAHWCGLQRAVRSIERSHTGPASNAITYRVFGCEKQREEAYEQNLAAYEKAAVRANIWNTALPPLYKVISMAGVAFILYFGGKMCWEPDGRHGALPCLPSFYPALPSCL